MLYHVTIGDRTLRVELAEGRATIDDVQVDQAELLALGGTGVHHLRTGAASDALVATSRGGGVWDLHIRGNRLTVEVVDERTRAIREMTGGHEVVAERTVVAPMPGLVLRVEVQVGDRVQAGQGVVIVEAMKMENELKAPGDGMIAKVQVEAGQTVEKGTVLLVLEA